MKENFARGDLMPWKDKAKNNAASALYGKKNYKTVILHIRLDSGIPHALDRMQEDLQMPIATYAHQALVVQLRNDGYLKDEMDGNEVLQILKETGRIK